MSKKIVATVLTAVIIVTVLSTGIVYGTEDGDLISQIEKLKDIITDKDAIIMEQVKVIMDLYENQNITYPDFSLEKYPETGGFSPEWLTGERVKIVQNCADAKVDGYILAYCQYVK